MYAIRIDSEVFEKNRTIITKGRTHAWIGVKNDARETKQVEVCLYPWTGRKIFQVYQHGQTAPEYWMVFNYNWQGDQVA